MIRNIINFIVNHYPRILGKINCPIIKPKIIYNKKVSIIISFVLIKIV
nr:MAG TPA: hypothetical protein [Caudoviricetes sp.]